MDSNSSGNFGIYKVGEGEGEVLEQLLQNAEQRELLSAMLARDKERLV